MVSLRRSYSVGQQFSVDLLEQLKVTQIPDSFCYYHPSLISSDFYDTDSR